MRKNEEVLENILKENNFSQQNMPNEWVRDSWTVRFYGNEMEIYESTEPKGHGRYLLTEIDLEILKEVLNDL